MIVRRDALRLMLGGGAALPLLRARPGWALDVANETGAAALTGPKIDLRVSTLPFGPPGKRRRAVAVNGSVPGPLLRWREGDDVELNVTNALDEPTSIHWHGILVPNAMDGVPGVTFDGIAPGATFTYRFRVKQTGTYWYHSHSGLQEQLGHYGPIVIEPAGGAAMRCDRDYVVMLSDWTAEDPNRVFARLKHSSNAYNYQQRTLGDWLAAARAGALAEQKMWARMRMDPTDLADVTGATYAYLVNGRAPSERWTGLFSPNERVKLRFINASAMTIFNVRIPALAMTVVAADGLAVKPIETDEIQIGIAETYDVIVTPGEGAYTVMAESIDRSGFGCATLATRLGMTADVPALRPRPLLTMRDMGMAGATPRLSERGVGLADEPHRVLVYTDLESAEPNPDVRAPTRELTLHLTGNMARYMWSFDGVKSSEVEGPIPFAHGERLRLTLVNDTMMSHPIHLHGMFFDVVTAEHAHKPRKHTIVLKPAERMSLDVTADALGEWALHCHMLYHMHAGMMRVVSVRDRGAQGAA